MKKLLLLSVLLIFVVAFLCAGILENYKKGTITLEAVAGYGAANDWEELFYDLYRNMVVAPDGSVFVSSSRQHNIFKFDKQGNFVKTIGRKGQGPSDLYRPGFLSILNNSLLVVGESSLNRRISLFDLNGKHVKVVKTARNNFYVTALRDNYISYLTYTGEPNKSNGFLRKHHVIIKNIKTGKERVVREITLEYRSSVSLGKGMSASIKNYIGEVFLFRTKEGNLGIGISNHPELEIYSPETMKLLRAVKLKITPVPVDGGYIRRFKNAFMKKLERQGKEPMPKARRFWHDLDVKAFKKFDFSTIFKKHLHLYNEILVDGEGNFLVFKTDDCVENCKIVFQVYSPNGEFVCETRLDKGKYDFVIDRRFKNICFTRDGIIGFFGEKGDEDEILKLIKSNYPPAP